MILALEFIGAIVILVPFALLQARRISAHAPGYLIANVVGSVILVGAAWVEGQWGFVLLQTVWALAAAWGLVRAGRRPPAALADRAAGPE